MSCLACSVQDLKETCSKTKQNVQSEHLMLFLLIMSFVSHVRQNFQFFHFVLLSLDIMKSPVSRVKQIHILPQPNKYPLFLLGSLVELKFEYILYNSLLFPLKTFFQKVNLMNKNSCRRLYKNKNVKKIKVPVKSIILR